MQRCRHEVRVHRFTWTHPPSARPNEPDGPWYWPVCERCHAVVPVNRGLDGKPRQRNVVVILFGSPDEPVGEVIEETVGRVVDEHELPQGGDVIEEPEPLKPRRAR